MNGSLKIGPGSPTIATYASLRLLAPPCASLRLLVSDDPQMATALQRRSGLQRHASIRHLTRPQPKSKNCVEIRGCDLLRQRDLRSNVSTGNQRASHP